jgi:hypothetical protein
MMFASTIRAGGDALDDANARRYSRDTQELYRLVEQLRTLVVHEAAEALDLRDRVRDSGNSALDGRWSSTEDLRLSAEEAHHEANALLASVRGADEVAAERAYKQARAELERAFFEYRQAHRELSVLVAICIRAAATSG